MVVETLSLDTISANSLQSLQQTLQTMQRLRVGTERVRSWYGAGTELVRSGSSIRFVIWYFQPPISYIYPPTFYAVSNKIIIFVP